MKRPVLVCVMLFVGGICAFLPAAAIAASTKPCLHMVRDPGHARYAPGRTLDIDITIEQVCADEIAALGIQEHIPEHWRFVDGKMIQGAEPAQWPAPGASHTLEIFWITIPPFPVTLRYTVEVPEDAQNEVEVYGQALYYRADGSVLERTDMVVTTLLPAAEAEGEGEGEALEEGEEPDDTVPDPEGEPEGENDQPPPVSAPAGCCRRAEKNAVDAARSMHRVPDIMLVTVCMLVLGKKGRAAA